MKSIRLSLLIYFLIVLALALGAVSVLVYEHTKQSLRAEEEATQQLLKFQYKANYQNQDSQYGNRCKAEQALYDGRVQEELARLDDSLFGRAQVLANYAHPYQALYPLGVLTAELNPQGHMLVPLWVAEVADGQLAYRLNRSNSFCVASDYDRFHAYYPLGMLGTGMNGQGHLLLPLWLAESSVGSSLSYRLLWVSPVRAVYAEELLPGNADGQDSEYSQICSDTGVVWQSSKSLAGEYLPFNTHVVDHLGPEQSHFETVKLRSGLQVRQITYRAALSRFVQRQMPSGLQPPRRGPNPGGRPNPPRPPIPGSRERPPSTFIIQCATDASPSEPLAQEKAKLNRTLLALQNNHKETLAGYESQLLEDQAQHKERADQTLSNLRRNLFFIALITFATAMCGGYWLVRLGLSPLRRLSDAVSRISEKDFRLPVEERHLPSELQPIVERLNQTLEMLKRAFAREKQAAADISHELRTPVAALLTTTEVALRKPRTTEEYRELLQDCHLSGQQMSRLVERLLALARLDAGVDTLRPCQVDVANLAEQCATLVRPLAEARELHVGVRNKDACSLTTDPDKLREILTNLLHNAIQYNRPHGSVEVQVERQNGHLLLAVRDTGIGIAAEKREHIFERFYRGDPSRQADGLHAGLGLAIVKGYVDLMGGSIAVDSVEGEGSTFRVLLPVT